MIVKKAQASDAAKLTDICIRSKSFWDYDAEQIEAWREELTITSTYIEENEVYILLEESWIGFYAFAPVHVSKVKLNFFFLDPEFIGQGYGKQFLVNFLKRARQLGYETVTLDADPNATAFYLKQGFEVVGQLSSSIEGRFLPIMEMKL